MMMGLLSGLAKGAGKQVFGAKTRTKYRKRRGRRLTVAQKNDLLFVKEAVGKTAAATYLTLLR